jgi:hypothetical protein
VQPTVGQIVHYVSYGSAGGEYPSRCRAAVVTEVAGDSLTVGVCVLNPTGVFFRPLSDGGCAHDEDHQRAGTWHWPGRA